MANEKDSQKGMKFYVDNAVANAPNDMSMTALVTATTSTGYTVKISGQEFTNVMTLVTVAVNDTVKVIIPNGQYSNMYILGKLKLV